MSAASEAQAIHPSRSWLGVAVAVLLSVLAVAGVQSYRDLTAVRAHEADLGERIVAAEARIERLDQRIRSIDEDPVTLERLAREELGMVRPDDVVIVLPEAGESPAPAAGSAPETAGPRGD